jgi:hypothetical protein
VHLIKSRTILKVGGVQSRNRRIIRIAEFSLKAVTERGVVRIDLRATATTVGED